MIDRQEVVRILDSIKGNKPTARASITSERLAALCRAWLALDGAPVGHADTATDYGGLMWTEIRGLIDDDIHAIDGQRVRIVKEPTHD